MEAKDLKALRKKLFDAQGGVCPILNEVMAFEESVVDHQHRTKDEPIGKGGAGLIRGVIHRQANVIEGKIVNSFRRYGLHKFGISIPAFLRNLADYLEQDNLRYIHPSEKPKQLLLKKSSYNALKKAAGRAERKFPEYPRSRKMTVALEKLFQKYKIKPEYYGA